MTMCDRVLLDRTIYERISDHEYIKRLYIFPLLIDEISTIKTNIMDINCDEMLNAYIDDELEVSERHKIQIELEYNLELRRCIDQLREVSTMVKKAYQDINN